MEARAGLWLHGSFRLHLAYRWEVVRLGERVEEGSSGSKELLIWKDRRELAGGAELCTR